MLDAVLLEWEGVLADTRMRRRDALRRALADEGVASSDTSIDDLVHGLSVHDAAAAVLRAIGRHDETLTALVALRASRAFGASFAHGIVLEPGAVAFVERMQQCTRLGIVTRASRDETETILRASGVESAISTIVTADDAGGATPTSAQYAVALDRLRRVRPTHAGGTVALVDASPSIHAGRAAGLRVIAVGAPAHVALDADGAVDGVDGLTVSMLELLATSTRVPRPA